MDGRFQVKTILARTCVLCACFCVFLCFSQAAIFEISQFAQFLVGDAYVPGACMHAHLSLVGGTGGWLSVGIRLTWSLTCRSFCSGACACALSRQL